MGLGTQTQTSETTIPGMGATARYIEQLLGQTAREAAGQLSPEAISTQATPEQLRYLQQIQESTGEVARGQMQAGLEESMGQVEDQALARGIPGSSIEQVMQAINLREHQRQMNEMIQRQRAETASQAVNTGFANADIQLKRNQLLLQQLLGAASPILSADTAARTAQPSSTATSQQDPFSSLFQLGLQGAGIALGGPAGATAAKAVTSNTPVYQ